MEEIINQSEDPLKKAVEITGMGNMIDYGADANLDLESDLVFPFVQSVDKQRNARRVRQAFLYTLKVWRTRRLYPLLPKARHRLAAVTRTRSVPNHFFP